MAGPRVNKMCCLGVYVRDVYKITCGWCPLPSWHTPATHPIFTLLHHTEEKMLVKKNIIQQDCCSFLCHFVVFWMQFTFYPSERDKIKIQVKQKAFWFFFGQVEINQQEKGKLFTTQSVIGRNVPFHPHHQKLWRVLSYQTEAERDT